MAVVETPVTSPDALGLRPLHEFDAANETWPRGDRPAAIREAAIAFRTRFAIPENRISAVRTVDIASAGYPLKFAFGGAAKGPNPYVNIINRLQVVQFEDFEGRPRTLAYEPTVPEGPAEAPFYAQMIERTGKWLAYHVLAKIWNHPDEALAKVGLRPEDVDFVSFDHLHVQDLRFVLGTTEPIDGEPAPRPPLFPNAKLIAQRREWDTFASLHPMQWAWYVEDGIKDLITDNVVLVDGDVELGKGVALVWTPGHTERGGRGQLASTPVGDPWGAQDRRVLRPRGDLELEHPRGLDRPVRLDDQGEGARRPEPARPAVRERFPFLGDGRLEAPVARRADLLLRRHRLRLAAAAVAGARGLRASRMRWPAAGEGSINKGASAAAFTAAPRAPRSPIKRLRLRD
jgi:hypothetical protein